MCPCKIVMSEHAFTLGELTTFNYIRPMYTIPSLGALSSPGHEIQSFFTSYLVPHFSEVWKCGKVWQSKDIVALSPSHEPLVILYLVPHFSEVWNCGIVRQSKDNLTTLCHSLLSSTLLRSRCGSVEKSNEVRRMSHFSPSHEPFVILYLVPHFSEVFYSTEVWNCWQVDFNVALSLSHEKLVRFMSNWFYFCIVFYIFL